jgi:hypothetical protein
VSGTVEFCGVDWRIGERVGLMPMLRYARVTKRAMQRQRNQKTDDEAGGADLMEMYDATLSLLEQCVHPDEWDRFEQVTTEHGVDHEGYMDFAGRVMAALTDRPTTRSSDSSDGPRIIEPSSTDDSSSPVIHRLNDKGRPDLALMVRKREESLAG